MSEKDFDPNAFPMATSEQAFLKQYVPDDDDVGVTATFFAKDEVMPFRSQAEGKEVKEKRNYVRIVVKGNDKMVVIRQVTEQDKKRFPYSWQQFARGEDQSKKGTPLSDLFEADAEIVPHYHALNVFTLEDLAQVNDTNLQALGAGARENRLRAREYLAKTKDAAKVASLEAELAEMKRQIAELSQKRGPGRPPKIDTEVA